MPANEITLLQDLAVVMIVAGVVTILCHRFRQPVVLGYILAGVIIGPHTPPFPLIHDEAIIHTLAELGLIFLMFSLGLDFNLRRLRAVGASVGIAAFLEILLMFAAGFQIGGFFDWSLMDRVFLGGILCISSTTIIIKALRDLDRTKEPSSELIFGILILEDLLGFILVALLTGFAITGQVQPGEVVVGTGQLAVFLVVILIGGLLIVPRLLRYVTRFKSDEMLLITVLGLCFSVSLLSVKLNYSVALGAFLMGAIISETRESGRIEVLTEPIRDMFSAVFFVATGLMINPLDLVEHWVVVLVVAVAVVVGKVVSCALGVFLAGHDLRTSLRVGLSLGQIGEFSFIIAVVGLSLGVMSEFLFPLAVAVSAITTFLTPLLIRSSDALASRLERTAPRFLVNYLLTYGHWVRRLGEKRRGDPGLRFLRKLVWQELLNLALIAGVFITAAFLARRFPSVLGWVPKALGGTHTVYWLAAVVLTLPILVVTIRKLQALSMLIAEISVPLSQAGQGAAGIRTVISATIYAVGLTGVFVLVALLSSAILPPARVLLVLLVMLAVVALAFGRQLSRVYARVKLTLLDTWNQPPAPRYKEKSAALTPVLEGAELETVIVRPDAPASGKIIRELELRTRTGASIVAIERTQKTLVNPGPDEEVQAGDRVLLLGTRVQIHAARDLLTRPGAAAPVS